MKHVANLLSAAASIGLLCSAAYAGDHTSREQLMLELVNRARLDPGLEAARFGINLNEGPPSTVLTATARQPLAANSILVDVARAHSVDMINRDYFAHTTPEGVTVQQRATNAGYTGLVGENIASRNVSPGPIDPTQAIIDEHADLFVDSDVDGRGHRTNILRGDYAEIGIGQAVGDYNGFSTAMATQDFGIPNPTRRFVTGVAYNDKVVVDNFYTIGEARADVKVNGSATTAAAGGYALAISTAAQNIVFSGGGLAKSITVAIPAGDDNIKLDIVNGDTVFSSTKLTLISGARGVRLLGAAKLNAAGSNAAELILGNRASNSLAGKGGRDTLRGGSGNDVLNGGADDDTLEGGPGRDISTGGPGADRFDFNAASESGLTDATRDVITDFVHLTDRIDVSTIDASSILPNNNTFAWMGSGPFTETSGGQLRFQKFDNAGTANDYTMVYGDTDADLGSEFEIRLDHLISLNSADFVR